jgi:1,4-dihydroxy-2-naphthoyl-CoA synthase
VRRSWEGEGVRLQIPNRPPGQEIRGSVNKYDHYTPALAQLGEEGLVRQVLHPVVAIVAGGADGVQHVYYHYYYYYQE